MNFKSFKKVVAIIISVIIVAACIPTISFGANAAATPKGVNISVTKTQVIIKINGIGKSGKASVYRYDANEYFEKDTYTGLSKEVGFDGDIVGFYKCGTSATITTNRYQNDGTDNLYAKYYVILNNEILAGPCYANEMTSLKTIPAFEMKTKKGLHLEDDKTVYEGKEMGISNTVINLDLGSLIVDKNAPYKNNVIEYESNGETYYFDANYIRQQDGLISAYTKENINVSLVLITWASAEKNGKYPESLLYVKGNRQTCGWNTSNEEGMKYWIAAMEFLGKRYSQPNRYGFVNKFIVGNEIDYTYDWYLMQPNYKDGKVQRMDFDIFMEEYARTLRLANMALKKYNSESKVVISFTHNWAESCLISYGYSATNQTTLRYNSYAPKDILDWLIKNDKVRGDFDWGICGHPYPIGTSPSNPMTTDMDPAGAAKPVTGDYKTSPWITVINLELYQQYFEQPENRYNGELREVSVIEGGICNLPKESSDAKDYKVALEEQAATIAQLYYRAALLECVTEVAYFRILDMENSTLRLGLREMDGTVKPSYNIWKYVDSNKGFNYANKYLNRIDWTGKAKSYKDIMDRVKSGFDWNKAWDESKIVVRTLPVEENVVSVKTDKTEYAGNEPINVTATGSEGDMVELYAKSDVIGVADPIYSYPVSGQDGNVKYKSGKTYNILAFGKITTSRISDAKLKAGNYVVAIYDGDAGKYVTAEFKVTSNYVYNQTSPSISTDKTVYQTGEPIVVTATGGSNAWVGLYKDTDSYGSGAGKVVSIYWYWVNSNTNFSGKPTVLQSGNHDTGSSNPGVILKPGKYYIYIFNDGGYNAVNKVEIEVVPADIKDLVSMEYKLDNATDGFANGTVTVTKDSKDETATDCVLYWGDANGNPLQNYTQITRFKLGDVTTKFTMPTHLVIPPEAKKLLAYTSDGSTTSKSAKVADLPANSQYNLTTDGMIAEFQVASDVHLTTDKEAVNEVKYSNKHFKMLLEDVVDNSPNSLGIVINGDFANTGSKSEFDKGYNIFNQVKAEKGKVPSLHLSIGNHDWIKGNPSSQFQVYAKLFNNNLEKQPENVYYDEVIGGYHFVYLGSEMNGLHASISQTQLDWFDDIMAKATQEDPDKPVFVFLHQSFYGTVAGSLPGQGWHGVNNEQYLKRIMAKYNQIILFNGHSHWEYDSTNNMFAGDEESSVAFNTASVSYLWTSYNIMGGEHLDGSQSYYVRTYKDKTVLLGRDVENGKFIASAVYVVEKNKLDLDKTDYVVAAGQEIQVIDVKTNNDVTVTFAPEDRKIVSVSDEGAIIPKAVGETKVVITVESSKTKVIARKTVNIKVLESANNWSKWVHDPETKTHSRTNLDTGVIEIKSCNSTLKKNIKRATFTKKGKVVAKCTVCKATVINKVVYPIKKVALKKAAFVFDGKTKTLVVNATTTKGKKIAAENYTIKMAKNKTQVGTYKVTIKFKNEYSGKKVLKYKINPKPTKLSSVKAISGGVTVKWKKGNAKTTKAYQVRYSTSKKFKGAKIVKVNGIKKVSTTISGLTRGKKYYVQVRAVKNGCYSTWSKAKNVTVK